MAREILERMQALAEEEEARSASAALTEEAEAKAAEYRQERQEAAEVEDREPVSEKDMAVENIDGSESRTFGDFDVESDEPARENNNRRVARNLLYMIGGGYLIYLAYRIFTGIRTEGVSQGVSFPLLVGAIVLFGLAGIVLIVMNVIDLIKNMPK